MRLDNLKVNKYPITNELIYFDGTLVRPEIGTHGLNSRLGKEDILLPAHVYGWQVSVHFESISQDSVGVRRNTTTNMYDTVNMKSVVEFIVWGRSHRYFTEDYYQVAKFWLEALISECVITFKHLQLDYEMAMKCLKTDGSFGAWMTAIIRDSKSALKGNIIFEPKEIDNLKLQAMGLATELRKTSTNDYDYPTIHSAGIVLMKIRYRQDYLKDRLLQTLEGFQEAAQIGIEGATTVAESAFNIIDLYGQVRFAGRPSRLAAYQCGVIFVRISASSIGEVIAETSYRKIFISAANSLSQQLPAVLVNFVKTKLKGVFKDPNKPLPGETFIEELIGLQIWLFFFSIDYFMFEVKGKPTAQREDAVEAFKHKLVVEGSLQLFQSFVAVSASLVKSTGQTRLSNEWLERFEATIPALISIIVLETDRLIGIANQKECPFYEVLCAELGTVMIRIIRATTLALAAAPLKKEMGASLQRNEDFYRNLILETNSRSSSSEMPIEVSESYPGNRTSADSETPANPTRSQRNRVTLSDVNENIGESVAMNSTRPDDIMPTSSARSTSENPARNNSNDPELLGSYYNAPFNEPLSTSSFDDSRYTCTIDCTSN